MSTSHFVLVYTSHGRSREVSVRPGAPVWVGRDPRATIVLHEDRASRRHATIAVDERTGALLVDAGQSTNGVIVGGRRQPVAIVRAGDSFELAGVHFRVLEGGPSAQPGDTLVRRRGAPRNQRIAFVAGGALVAAILGVGVLVFVAVRGGPSAAEGEVEFVAPIAAAEASAVADALGVPPSSVELRTALEAGLTGLPAGSRVSVREEGGADSPGVEADRVVLAIRRPGEGEQTAAFLRVETDGQETLIPVDDGP